MRTLFKLFIAIGLFATATSVPVQAAPVETHVEISTGFQKTFAVSGKTSLTLGPARRSRIGPDATGPGEITVSLAPPGGAVGIAKLHVFERTAVPVGFTATAFRGKESIATVKVNGCLNLDAWVTLPVETTRVRLSDFKPIENVCK
ncbi:hypothetical protein HB779_15300 [Phyllobacterium sp. 628]|uniref:hypothetical protein n=1 Tax=Phyllobacterium sp. 628 TaxID=2718938 RepID=UPI001662650C|nr:hypothetical protein [Phyllobacterium sp. 628]QND53115.1 hypothetical protein HB779_15300 [Phyllobacterium sp. 628]